MSTSALGHLLTWTCYGTWLHGDPRGSVDDDHNLHGHPVLQADVERLQREAALLSQSPMLLSDEARRVVVRAIVEHCPYRRVDLRALSVRTNHVHAVVTVGPMKPGKLVGSFKARATFCLREAGIVGPEEEVWGARSSTEYLWTPESMERAVDYVARLQGPPDEFTVRAKDLARFHSEPPAAAGG